MNIEKFIAWLKEPSTIKAFVLFLGLVGVHVTPEYTNEIVTSAIVLYAGIAAFLDKG